MLIYEKIIEDIFLVYSDSQFWFKCNGILIENKNFGNILIDCNCYYKEEIENLEMDKIEAYFVSHVHLDHVYNLHFYEELDPSIKIYCPIPENEYLRDFNNFVRDNGVFDFGIEKNFKKFAFEELGFKELKSIIGFLSGKEFEFGDKIIKTIPIPGHSPSHTAFSIKSKDEEKKKVLFVSDIGLTKMGAWYGFGYSNLNFFRDSIKKIEDIYLNDDYIITSGHGPIIFDKSPKIFNDLLVRINDSEEKVLSMFNSHKPKCLNDLIFKGLFFNQDFIKDLDENRKSIIFFFENNMIMSHIKELKEKGKIIQVDTGQWILKKNN